MSNALIDERPPTADEIGSALAAYVTAVSDYYGSRLKGIVLFGSRARGDHHDSSDADVAVVIEDGDWIFWSEKVRLADLTYDPMMEFGLKIQPWPVARSAWEIPLSHHNPRLIEAMQRDGRSLLVPT